MLMIIILTLDYTDGRRTRPLRSKHVTLPHPPRPLLPSSLVSSSFSHLASTYFSYTHAHVRQFYTPPSEVRDKVGTYLCFALSSTLSPNSIPFMFCLALFKSTSFPCVEPVSCKYSFTIKLNTMDVHTINVKTKRYPLYHGGANTPLVHIR